VRLVSTGGATSYGCAVRADRVATIDVHGECGVSYLRDQLGDLGPLDAAARLLADSQPMAVCGFRGSVPLASWFSFFASKIHPSVAALWGSDSHLLEKIAQAKLAGATSMLAIVVPRYPTEALLAMQAAKREGSPDPGAVSAAIVVSALVG
jgi:hypothetical protein